MTLRQFVDRCGDNGSDAIAVAAIKLGVNYFTVYRWLRHKKKPGRLALKNFKQFGIEEDQ